MTRIDFNSSTFKGFEDKEDILLDTGIILAFLNSKDAWHKTVSELFSNHIIDNDNVIFLYVNPTSVNEVTFLSDKPLQRYAERTGLNITNEDILKSGKDTVEGLKKLIDSEIVFILEGNKESVLKQLSIYEKLGDADAVYASIANEYGISFLTVDNRLVNNMFSIHNELNQIKNVYYTVPTYREY